MSAAGLIELLGAHHDTFPGVARPLRSVSGISADHANREGLCDVLGDGEQLGNGLKWFTAIVLVKSGDDHTFAVADVER